MTRGIQKLTIFGLLCCSLGLSGCSQSDPEMLGKTEQRGIRSPASTRVDEELGTTGQTTVDPSNDFDDRRDAWEDEDPAVGEDPQFWNQAGTTAPVKQFGYQWLRSYARNSTVAFFEASDFVDAGNGTVKLIPLRESPAFFHQAELELDSLGFDLCPEKRFADQMRQGAVAPAECTGTLIDHNLILTAAHCVRDAENSSLVKAGVLDNVRVAFNYVLSHPGQIITGGTGNDDPRELRFVPERDVFKVREVLTLHVKTMDMSILQLVKDDGQPVEDLDPMYVPVPLWEAATPPMTYKQYRPGAAIGVGARMPQKITLSRSKGWGSDPQFLGININADLFPGNSGGGVYDVETGSLVGVVHAEFEHELNITCPSPPATANPWPFCPIDGGSCETSNDCRGAPCVPVRPPTPSEPDPPKVCRATPGPTQLKPMTLNRVPEFDFSNPAIPVMRGCAKWTPQGWSDLEKPLVVAAIRQQFDLDADSVKLDVGLPAQSDAVGVSLAAVRRMACGPSNSSDPFDVALQAAAQQALADAQDAARLGSANCKGEATFTFCPSTLIVDRVANNGPDGGLFHSDFADMNDAAQILRDSRLCAGTTAQTQHQSWISLPEITPEFGRETTFHGTTNLGKNYFDMPSEGSSGDTPDELYRVSVDEWTVLYADTFSGGVELQNNNPATTFDTILFVMEATDPTEVDPALDAASWTENSGVFDDSGCDPGATDLNFRLQSQLTTVLAPGKRYILGVTGFGGQRGKFNLHTQLVPAPRNGQLLKPQDAPIQVDNAGETFDIYQMRPFEPTATEAACQNGMASDEPFDPACFYSAQPPIFCQRTDTADYGFVSVSCPDFHSSRFRFRVEATSSPFSFYLDDPVGQYWEGQVRHDVDGYICGDDSKQSIPFVPFPVSINSFSSEIGSPDLVRAGSAETVLSSGAGVRVFYAHQFQVGLNWQNLGFSLMLPRSAANDIWTR
jgi:hypothetical protein